MLIRGVKNTFWFGGECVEDCAIIDWLTFSHRFYGVEDAMALLGLAGASGWREESGSRMHYEFRRILQHITIHYTNNSKKFMSGCCVEMSGQGCREFETYSRVTWQNLISFLYSESRLTCRSAVEVEDLPGVQQIIDVDLDRRRCQVSRFDLAFDDHSGLIDIDCMADQARRLEYTAFKRKLQIVADSDIADPDHVGVSVNHGARSSDVFIRFYDKRVERGRFDLPHWIRGEIQLRHDAAQGALELLYDTGFNIGFVYSSILNRYLQYRDRTGDSNRARWPVSDWWSNFVGSVAGVSIISRKDVEYNKSRMDRYAYDQNHNHTLCEIGIDGLGEYLLKLRHGEDMPDKYLKVAGSVGALEQVAALAVLSDREYIERLMSELQHTLDQLRKDDSPNFGFIDPAG